MNRFTCWCAIEEVAEKSRREAANRLAAFFVDAIRRLNHSSSLPQGTFFNMASTFNLHTQLGAPIFGGRMITSWRGVKDKCQSDRSRSEEGRFDRSYANSTLHALGGVHTTAAPSH
ncbi:hypothetical protein TcWFU_007067 [Taenia crassiceps]|uniref:Uncharacterized protein n=1 Tax=Taenia crassiceps TaxID=6207 RepID=A0ABR4Q2P1_9CEST